VIRDGQLKFRKRGVDRMQGGVEDHRHLPVNIFPIDRASESAVVFPLREMLFKFGHSHNNPAP
jgi:hypothetical protein